MKVTLPKQVVSSLTGNHRKENFCHDSYTVIDSDFNEWVDARIYWNPKADGMSRMYCCIWVKGDDKKNKPYLNGSSYASGCGYHKPSAALSFAIKACDIKLSEPIDGRGDEAMREALLAIGRAQSGKRKLHLVRSCS